MLFHGDCAYGLRGWQVFSCLVGVICAAGGVVGGNVRNQQYLDALVLGWLFMDLGLC